MITRKEYLLAHDKAVEMIRKAGMTITDEEIEGMEVTDFGLGELYNEGAQILTLLNTNRISVRVIALFPHQTEPEHRHTALGADPGKQETVRVVSGDLRFYIPGEESIKDGFIPPGKEDYYTARHEILLHPGEQITLDPETRHWFQAGKAGAVMFVFSSQARDAFDPFTDPAVVRISAADAAPHKE